MPEIVPKDTQIKLLLGITGGIAAYKTPELVRRLKEHNFDVRVVITESAANFVAPMSLQAVSGYPVHDQLFDCQAEAAMGHIELAKWADVILVAPATANSIAKMAIGLADDLLTTLILASSAKLVIAPAMNQQMWANQATINNIEQLQQRAFSILGPDEGEQACGDVGLGRMLSPDEIINQLVELLNRQNPQGNGKHVQALENSLLVGKKITITAGPTIEAIDPVRFISNHSSGKMGYALATAAVAAGAVVTLISGPVSLEKPDGLTLKSVNSAKQMFSAVKEQIINCDIFIGCAAVADYAPEEIAEQKIKKSSTVMQITLKRNPDIISWVAEQTNKPFVVGFAAESQNLEKYAQDKLKRKNLDIICANDISNQNIGFNSNKNEITLLQKDGERTHLKATDKMNIAKSIIQKIAQAID